MEEEEAIVELLEEILGDYGLHYSNKGQISFNCPVCDEGRGKHNLEIVKCVAGWRHSCPEALSRP